MAAEPDAVDDIITRCARLPLALAIAAARAATRPGLKLGLVAPGDRFPAERGLAARLGISRLTLREAIRELQEAGYVESRRGRLAHVHHLPAAGPERG